MHDTAVTEPHTALAAHYNNQDLDALVQLFDLDGTLVPEPGVALTGASLRDGLAGLLQLGGTMSVQVLDVVTVGDLALTRTAWSVDTPASPRQVGGSGVEVLRRQADNTWRFVIDSPFGPAPDTQTAAPTGTATIAQQVDDHEHAVASGAPPDLLAAFTEEKATLAGRRPGPDVPTPGMLLPEGSLLDAHGGPTSLTQARNGRPAVVVFYRGPWCPYCSITLRTYQADLVPALSERGIALIAISPQAPDGSLTTQEANGLTFTVLSDPGNHVATRLGILTSQTSAARRIQHAMGIDVTASNADGTDNLPIPTTLIVDHTGTIRWIDVHPDYTTRTEVADILSAADSLLPT